MWLALKIRSTVAVAVTIIAIAIAVTMVAVAIAIITRTRRNMAPLVTVVSIGTNYSIAGSGGFGYLIQQVEYCRRES